MYAIGTTVQSVRGVGSVRGWPYFAWGLYQVRARRDGSLYWKLTESGPRFRSDVRERCAFRNVPKSTQPVRHGSDVIGDEIPQTAVSR